MKYIIEIALFLIVVYASKKAKKQMHNALEAKEYDAGLYFKMRPLTGEKAVRMARVQLTIAKIAPWAMGGLILIYNLLDWIR